MRRSNWIAGLVAGAAALAVVPAAANAANYVGASSSNGGKTLYFFSSDGITVTPGATRAVTGLTGNDRIAGLDVRPATGELYALGYNGSSVSLYTLNTAGAGAVAATPLPDRVYTEGVTYGFDFNPVVDRVRQTSDSQLNRRLNPIPASPRLVQDDGTLAYAPGDPRFGREPQVTASAYTNNDNDAATGTTLYNIDSATDRLVTQAPPNDGTLNMVGSLGRDVSGSAGFDIAGASNAAFAVLQMGGKVGQSWLSSVNLTTGRATPIGTVAAPALSSLAILPGI